MLYHISNFISIIAIELPMFTYAYEISRYNNVQNIYNVQKYVQVWYIARISLYVSFILYVLSYTFTRIYATDRWEIYCSDPSICYRWIITWYGYNIN